jgi:very-short-patch-repair endonuclease
MKDDIKLAVRNLRKNETEAEKRLWKRLRNRGCLRKKFLRQYPLFFEIEGKTAFFIADFFCHEKKLVIEVDGGIHLQQKKYDQFRDLIIRELGLKIVRVTNKTVENDLDNFLADILCPVLKAD